MTTKSVFNSAFLSFIHADYRAVLCCVVLCCGVFLLQVHVRHLPASGNSHLGQNWLADLTAAWKEAGLWITRAKVRASPPHQHSTLICAGTTCSKWLPLCAMHGYTCMSFFCWHAVDMLMA
jgi:hypothetical protein